jgi:DNA-binding transcriptional MocR family regulator
MPKGCPWINRIWREFRIGNLTRSYRDILLTLRTFRGSGGLICPSHATLAERTGCSISSVQRALKQADHLGLLHWIERRVRSAWRWLRTSNRYTLLMPETPVIGGLRTRSRPLPALTVILREEGNQSFKKKETLKYLLAEAARLPDLLKARREALQLVFATVSRPAFSPVSRLPLLAAR